MQTLLLYMIFPDFTSIFENFFAGISHIIYVFGFCAAFLTESMCTFQIDILSIIYVKLYYLYKAFHTPVEIPAFRW